MAQGLRPQDQKRSDSDSPDVSSPHGKHERQRVLDIWRSSEAPAKTVILVTHSIEKAVYVADCVVALKPQPGRVAGEHLAWLSLPRQPGGPELREHIEALYAFLVQEPSCLSCLPFPTPPSDGSSVCSSRCAAPPALTESRGSLLACTLG